MGWTSCIANIFVSTFVYGMNGLCIGSFLRVIASEARGIVVVSIIDEKRVFYEVVFEVVWRLRCHPRLPSPTRPSELFRTL